MTISAGVWITRFSTGSAWTRVSKATYLPICLRAKASLFTFSIENYALGVTEESVTFDPAAYPNANIIDKR